jgi:hypothetical protein
VKNYATPLSSTEEEMRLTAILHGCYEILSLLEEQTESWAAPETSVALRQALTYVGVARDRWRGKR